MKKYFFGLFAIFAMSTSASFANIIIDDPLLDNENKGNKGTKGITPSVQIEALNDVLSIDINRYLGNAVVSVLAADGSSSISGTYYINGHDTVCLDFTGYSEGLYQMTITLGNGDVYLGSFRIE